MSTRYCPDEFDHALLEAFAGLLATSAEAARVERDELALAEVLDRHDEHRLALYLTPPRTVAGVVAKLVALLDPCLGLQASGATGFYRSGADIQALAQAALFLTRLPGAMPAMPAEAAELYALALATVARQAGGELSARTWFGAEVRA